MIKDKSVSCLCRLYHFIPTFSQNITVINITNLLNIHSFKVESLYYLFLNILTCPKINCSQQNRKIAFYTKKTS